MKSEIYDTDEIIKKLSDFFDIPEEEVSDIALRLGLEIAESAMDAQKSFILQVENAKNTKS